MTRRTTLDRRLSTAAASGSQRDCKRARALDCVPLVAGASSTAVAGDDGSATAGGVVVTLLTARTPPRQLPRSAPLMAVRRSRLDRRYPATRAARACAIAADPSDEPRDHPASHTISTRRRPPSRDPSRTPWRERALGNAATGAVGATFPRGSPQGRTALVGSPT